MSYKPYKQTVRLSADLKELLARKAEQTGTSENTLICIALRSYLGSGDASLLEQCSGLLLDLANKLRSGDLVNEEPVNLTFDEPLALDTIPQITEDDFTVSPSLLSSKAHDKKVQELIQKFNITASLTPSEIAAIHHTEATRGDVDVINKDTLMSLKNDLEVLEDIYHSLTLVADYPEDWVWIRETIEETDPLTAARFNDDQLGLNSEELTVEHYCHVIEMLTTAYRGCVKPLDFRKSHRQQTYRERVDNAIEAAKEEKRIKLALDQLEAVDGDQSNQSID